MHTEKQIRRVIREELRSALVKYKVKKLNEQDETSPTTDEEPEKESMSVSDAKKIILTFVKEELGQIPASQMDEFIKIMRATAEKAVAKQLSGTAETAIGKKLEV